MRLEHGNQKPRQGKVNILAACSKPVKDEISLAQFSLLYRFFKEIDDVPKKPLVASIVKRVMPLGVPHKDGATVLGHPVEPKKVLIDEVQVAAVGKVL